MKLFVYNYRKFDEAIFFEKYKKELGVEVGYCQDAPSLSNAHLAQGYEYISIITSQISAELMDLFQQLGVKMISTRTIGYDHIDCQHAVEIGMGVSNATYSPYCVADYTIMLMLMSIRKMKRIMERAVIQDFSLPGIMGREMPGFTVGILGTGQIGSTVIRYLSGFGCKIYAYDIYEKESVKEFAEYTDLDTIYEKCDMISLHMPLLEDNYHIIDSEAISKMREGVILINTARGGLIDSQALIEGIEQGKIGAAGLDVVEKEFGLYYYDLKSEVLDNRELAILRSFPNVIVTPHMAFYTDQAIDDMVSCSMKSCILEADNQENPWQVLPIRR